MVKSHYAVMEAPVFVPLSRAVQIPRSVLVLTQPCMRCTPVSSLLAVMLPGCCLDTMNACVCVFKHPSAPKEYYLISSFLSYMSSHNLNFA